MVLLLSPEAQVVAVRARACGAARYATFCVQRMRHAAGGAAFKRKGIVLCTSVCVAFYAR
jgi:hypothetical protein